MEGYITISTIILNTASNVYLVENIETREMLICKQVFLSKEYDAFPELNALKTLHHPNIVRMSKYRVTDNSIYIFEEYINGGDMLDIIINYKYIPEHDARIYFKQLISALEYIHSKDLVHLDVKLDNILVRDMEIKLCDFGFVHNINDPLSRVCGTLNFISPEVWNKEEYVSGKADMWSAGVCLYTLLCGKLPFKTQKTRNYADYHFNHIGFDKISNLAIDLIVKLLQADPYKRLSSTDCLKHAWFEAKL